MTESDQGHPERRCQEKDGRDEGAARSAAPAPAPALPLPARAVPHASRLLSRPTSMASTASRAMSREKTAKTPTVRASRSRNAVLPPESVDDRHDHAEREQAHRPVGVGIGAGAERVDEQRMPVQSDLRRRPEEDVEVGLAGVEEEHRNG